MVGSWVRGSVNPATTLSGECVWAKLDMVLCFVRETPSFRGGEQLMATENVALAAGAEGGTLSRPDTQQQSQQGVVVNDFSIQIATVNGSGSQSANSVLLKSIFRMGIPVSGKNLFPSNIAGLPTWYTIRASKNGYVARKKEIDILVAMNAETAKDDILSLPAGAVAIYEDAANLAQYRNDVVCYPVPFDKLTAAACPEARLRKLV